MDGRRHGRLAVIAALAAGLITACAGTTSEGEVAAERVGRIAPATTSTTAAEGTTTLPPETTTTAAPATTLPPVPTTPVPRPRRVHEQQWTPFATVGGVVLHHPSSRVEMVGFHQSNHDGARDMEPLGTAVEPNILEDRERGTAPRTAADIVVDPAVEIRSPVTGTVIRGGGYILYCDHADHYVVIEPDSHPGWEVKVLHIQALYVGRGDRVEAGVTVLAPGPTQLPFESQVDEITADPAWPHTHIEVVDPSIPDRPSGPGC